MRAHVLLGPIDISQREIQLFHKSLTVSFWGFVFIPLGMLLVKLISTGQLLGWLEKKISGGILTYAAFLFSPCIVIAAVYFENIQTVFNLNFRASIGVHLFIVVLLVFTAPALVDSDRKRTFFYFSLTGIFFLMIFYMKDAGFIINGISLGLTVFILVHWKNGRKIKLLPPLSLVAAFFILLLWAGPHISQQLAKLIPQEKHWHYRMMENQENWEQLLLDDSRKNIVEMRLLLRNAHQRWQMLLYAAEGCRQPRGFGKAPLSDRGMTYPAALTDCFYSYFVLSEWGKETGVLLILLLFTLGFFILYPGGFLPTGYRYRILPLTAIGLFFIVNSLYISSANIGLMPFSGINLPLFGLYSRSGIVQSGIFLLLAVWLTHDSIQTGSQKFCDDPPVVRYLFPLLLAGFLTWIGLHYFQLKELARNEHYTRDFNFSRQFYFSLKDTFPRITSSIENASIFKSLEQLFDFHITGDYYKILRGCGEWFLPSFRDFDFKTNMYLNNITPEPVIFNPRYYQYNRGHLISFFLGGGPNRINNIAMAQAAARMVTGRKVTAVLEKRPPGSTEAPVLPPPLGLTEWRNENLVFPLEQVGQTGTARELSDLVEFPYRVVYKTGTIIKSEQNGRESETILFAIGLWEGDRFEGKTLVVFLYMEDSKNRKDPQKKFQLTRPVIKALLQYLKKARKKNNKGGYNDFENK